MPGRTRCHPPIDTVVRSAVDPLTARIALISTGDVVFPLMAIGIGALIYRSSRGDDVTPAVMRATGDGGFEERIERWSEDVTVELDVAPGTGEIRLPGPDAGGLGLSRTVKLPDTPPEESTMDRPSRPPFDPTALVLGVVMPATLVAVGGALLLGSAISGRRRGPGARSSR